MTAEEIFCDLFDKYVEKFNWHMLAELGKDRAAESAAVELVRKFIYKGDRSGKSHG